MQFSFQFSKPVLILALALVIGAGHPGFSQEEKDVVAIVGARKITKDEFNRRYKEVVSKTVNPPPKELFLEDLVRYEVGVQEAQKRKLENDPIVQERIRQVLYVDLIEKEIGAKADEISVSEAEMQSYYQKNPEIRTSHILIELKENANRKEVDAARARANQIYKEVRQSQKPFEQLVKLYSDDVISKKNGGDIGWHASNTLIPEYYQAALKLKDGQISNLVETKYGFHIIKLTGRRSYKDADKVKLRAAVMEVKKKALFDNLFNRLKSQYSIKTFPNNL
jgi:peptidyl-prolyl cis-trans isomerase C/peptidyl-prolyl cis-trans isomerase D